jgi:hypothetical protein
MKPGEGCLDNARERLKNTAISSVQGERAFPAMHVPEHSSSAPFSTTLEKRGVHTLGIAPLRAFGLECRWWRRAMLPRVAIFSVRA